MNDDWRRWKESVGWKEPIVWTTPDDDTPAEKYLRERDEKQK